MKADAARRLREVESGCIPESLRDAASGVGSLSFCTTTTTYALTTEAEGNGRISPLRSMAMASWYRPELWPMYFLD